MPVTPIGKTSPRLNLPMTNWKDEWSESSLRKSSLLFDVRTFQRGRESLLRRTFLRSFQKMATWSIHSTTRSSEQRWRNAEGIICPKRRSSDRSSERWVVHRREDIARESKVCRLRKKIIRSKWSMNSSGLAGCFVWSKRWRTMPNEHSTISWGMASKSGKVNRIDRSSLISIACRITEIAKGGPIAEFFDQRGYACVEKSQLTEEKATELAIEINAEEVAEGIDDDGVREVWKVSRFHRGCLPQCHLRYFIAVSGSTDVRRPNESGSRSARPHCHVRRRWVYSQSDRTHEWAW